MKRPSTYKKKQFTKATSVLSPVMHRIAKSRGFSDTRILTHWKELVGSELAELVQPRGIQSRQNGQATLTLEVVGAKAAEAQMRLHEIQSKLNFTLGGQAIHKIRLQQVSGFSEPKARFERPTPKILPTETAQIKQIENSELRAALAQMAGSVKHKYKTSEKL